MSKTLLFDMDGTLLDMDQEDFVRHYIGSLTRYMIPHGYDPKELAAAIWQGVAAMYQNDGSKTNADIFWKTMQKFYGQKILDDLPVFEAYYQGEYQNIGKLSVPNPKKMQMIQDLKDKYRLVLATNPLFPAIATKSRLKWAGLNEEDFDLITTFEDFHYSKPNPMYFKEVLERLQLDPKETIMIGNDVHEDGCALQAGIPLFLLEDFLINKQELPIEGIPHGSIEDLEDYLRNLS